MGLETIQKLRMAGHSHYEETEPKGRHKACPYGECGRVVDSLRRCGRTHTKPGSPQIIRDNAIALPLRRST